MTNEIKFNYVSLFSGIGGFEQALNKLGGKCVLASEIDKFANQAYEALYGEATAGDITKINEKDVPDHDILVGGFPCQSFSVAGKRKGFDDTRGTLFFEIARIAKEKQPKVLLLENVKGLVNHDKGKTLNVMIETLCEIGYTVDFEILNSKHFNVPQNRERIFIVALRDDLAEPEKWVIEGNTIIPRGKQRIQEIEGIKSFNFDFPTNDTVTTRLRDVLETEVDEKYYLDDERTAKLVAQLEDRDLDVNPNEINVLGNTGRTGHGNFNVFSDEGIGRTVAARDYKDPIRIAEAQGLPIREATKKGFAVAHEGDAVNFQFPDSKTRRGRVGKQIANTLEASNINQGTVVRQDVVEAEEVRPDLTPDRVEKRQNGRRFKEDGEESFMLTAQDKHGVVLGKGSHYRVRKLTPLECWRLQGFDDVEFYKAKAAGLSDSQLYKQAGNAVTTTVIYSIGQKLLKYLEG